MKKIRKKTWFELLFTGILLLVLVYLTEWQSVTYKNLVAAICIGAWVVAVFWKIWSDIKFYNNVRFYENRYKLTRNDATAKEIGDLMDYVIENCNDYAESNMLIGAISHKDISKAFLKAFDVLVPMQNYLESFSKEGCNTKEFQNRIKDLRFEQYHDYYVTVLGNRTDVLLFLEGQSKIEALAV